MTKKTLRSGLEELNTKQSQALLKGLAPDIEAAAHDLVTGLLDGTLDYLDDDARRARIQELADEFGQSISTSLSKLGGDLGPALREEVVLLIGDSVDAALDQALSPQRKAQLSQLTQGVVGGATRSMASGLREDLGPALRDEMLLTIEAVRPELEKIWREDLSPMIRDGAKQATEGAVEGLATQLDGPSGEKIGAFAEALTDRILKRVEQSVATIGTTGEGALERLSRVLLLGLLIAIAIGVVAITALALRLRIVNTRAAQREKAVGLLTDAVHKASAFGSVDHVLDHVKALGRDGQQREGYEFIERYLARNPQLKAERATEKHRPGS